MARLEPAPAAIFGSEYAVLTNVEYKFGHRAKVRGELDLLVVKLHQKAEESRKLVKSNVNIEKHRHSKKQQATSALQKRLS